MQRLSSTLKIGVSFSQSVNPKSDVCVTFGRKALDLGLPLKDQGVEEGSVLRIHYRVRGGAPGDGQPECYASVGSL